MTDAKKPRQQSPFAEMTFAEQQDMWRAWRSRQLDYQPAKRAPAAPSHKELPPLELPLYSAPAAPAVPSHRHLDKLRENHLRASRQARGFIPADKA